MPELTVFHIVLLAALAVVGAIAGWLLRGSRAAAEKEAMKTMWQDEADRQRKEGRRLADQNKTLMEQVSEHQVHRGKLQQEVEELSGTVHEAESRCDGLQRQIDAREVRSDTLANELKKWQERLPPLIERYRIRNEEAEQYQAALDEALAQIRRLEEQRDASAMIEGGASNDDQVCADDSGTALPGNPAAERDNLKEIKGVGPAIEKTLNEMGIFSFRQLAELGDCDIDRVARRLKGFHSRIHREDWIGQARTLLDGTASA